MDPDLGDPSAVFSPLPADHSADERSLLPLPVDDGDDAAAVGAFGMVESHLLGSPFDRALPISVEEEAPHLHGSPAPQPLGIEPSCDAAAGEEALPASVDAADHLDGSQVADPPAFECAGPSSDYVAGEESLPVSVEAVASVPAKRKRGRPPKYQGASRKTTVAKKKEEEEVCFICFDGGNLVVCDRRGCPKVYHPACIKRDEAFFRSRSRWNCGWHICSICERASTYMCYTCTYSLCKNCIREASFFCVRDTKGFCETCYKTIMLIESNGQANGEKATVDFDDRSSWEYLFKVYWLVLKGKLSLKIDEIRNAKNPWKGFGTLVGNEETSDELYDAHDDQEASSDCSSVHHEGSISSRKRAAKRSRKSANGERPAKDVEIEKKNLPEDHRWASQELLEFVAHMKNGDTSVLSQFDVQALLLEYIKKKSLRDPHKKSQIVCDTRLHNLFGKERVGHFEMLKLLESHFLIKETSQIGTDDNQVGTIDSDHGQMDDEEYNTLAAATSSDKRQKTRKRLGERDLQSNLDEYAAIDVHNVNLIYLRRNLAEGLVDDNKFSEKVIGLFVRIRIPGAGQKQEMYRLVQVVGTNAAPQRYKVGKKSTDISLQILNLNKEESLTIDAISNQEFTEDECRRLRQSIKCGLVRRLTVGDLLEKAKVLQEVRVNDWLESEKLRLSHLRDRASDLGRRKDLRECVEKLQILERPEERQRRLNEVPEIHADSHMDPSYESPEEADDKKEDKFNRSREPLSQRRGKKLLSPGVGSISNYQWNGTAKILGTGRTIAEGIEDKMEELVSGGDRINDLSRNKNIVGWINNSETSKAPMHATKPETNIWNCNQLTTKEEQSNDIPPDTMLASSGVHVPSNNSENDKVWHYRDPSGIIQGPFSMIQLRKWSSTGYFPPDLRTWLTSQKQEESMLLTDVLAKVHKDSQRQESQLTNIRQPSTFVGISANTGHDWDTGWRENNNPTLVSVKQNSNLWSVNQTDITNNTAGYKLPNIDRQTPQPSNYIEPKSKLIAQDGRIRGSADVWDSSKDTNTWYGQTTSYNNRGPGFSAPFVGYNSPTYQVVCAQAENTERWNKNQDHGSSWSSVRSGPVRPTVQGYEDPHPSWSPSSQHSHQVSLQCQKIQPANNAGNQWANEAYGSPTPTPQPSGMNRENDRSHMNVSNTVQSAHFGWQAIPSAGLHQSSTDSMDPKKNVSLTNSVGGWGSNSTPNALNQSATSKGWVAESSTLVAAADAKLNFGKVDNLDDSSPINQQKKPFEYNIAVSSTGSSVKSHFFGSSCPSPTPSSERDDSPPSQMNKPNTSKNWNETSGNAVAESQVDASYPASRPLDPNVPLISAEQDAMSPVKSKEDVAEKITELEKLAFLPHETESSRPLSPKPDVLETDSIQSFESLLRKSEGCGTNPASSSRLLGQTHAENPGHFSGPMDVFKDTKGTEWSLPSDMPASVMSEDAADKSWIIAPQNPNIGGATHGNRGWVKSEQANDSNIGGGIAQGSTNVGWGTAQVTRAVTGWTTPTQKSTNANAGWAASGAQGNMNTNAGWVTPASNSGWGATFKASSDAESGWAVPATGYSNQNGGMSTGWGTTFGSKNDTWNSTTRYPDVSDSQQLTHGGYRGGDGGDNPQGRSYFGGTRGGGSSRLPRGPGQRGVCKFYESGHCKKGASCNYLHP